MSRSLHLLLILPILLAGCGELPAPAQYDHVMLREYFGKSPKEVEEAFGKPTSIEEVDPQSPPDNATEEERRKFNQTNGEITYSYSTPDGDLVFSFNLNDQVFRLTYCGGVVSPSAKPASVSETADGMLREYARDAALTEAQEQSVIALANKRGIEKVAKIKTYHLLPTDLRAISVEGVDQRDGREIAQPMLTVNFKDWSSPDQRPDKGDLQIGDFWAGKPVNRKFTVLAVGKKEYRVSSIHGLTIERCESILGRLQAGEYTLADGVEADRLKGIDWKKPTAFGKFGESVNASFRAEAGGGAFYSLRVNLTEGTIKIADVMLAMP